METPSGMKVKRTGAYLQAGPSWAGTLPEERFGRVFEKADINARTAIQEAQKTHAIAVGGVLSSWVMELFVKILVGVALRPARRAGPRPAFGGSYFFSSYSPPRLP